MVAPVLNGRNGMHEDMTRYCTRDDTALRILCANEHNRVKVHRAFQGLQACIITADGHVLSEVTMYEVHRWKKQRAVEKAGKANGRLWYLRATANIRIQFSHSLFVDDPDDFQSAG